MNMGKNDLLLQGLDARQAEVERREQTLQETQSSADAALTQQKVAINST